MEQLGKVIEMAADSAKRENQAKQIGSDEYCQKHPEERLYLKTSFDYENHEHINELICTACENEAKFERFRKIEIAAAMKAMNLSPRLEEMTFESYQPKTKNAKSAKATCVSFSKEVLAGASGGLILLGGVGTGKTHLAVAIAKTICQQGKRAFITSIPKMIRHIRSSWNGSATDDLGTKMSEDDVIRKYVDYDLLIIDEIGIQYGSDSEKISVSEVINERYNRKLPTVIIGNVKLSEAEDFLGSRVIDRIKDDGTVVVFDWESHRKMKSSR